MTSKIPVAKRNYFETVFEDINQNEDSRKLNVLMQNHQIQLPDCQNMEKLADQFNMFFTDKIQGIRNSLVDQVESISEEIKSYFESFEHPINPVECEFVFSTVTESEILKIVKSMKNKLSKQDPIPIEFLKMMKLY